jgi:hypothetical protein
MSDKPNTLLSEGSAAWRLLAAAARTARMVVFCGIPGVGKSFLLREQLRLALAAGRRVSLLQWDVSRQAFEIPAILHRYPELQGSTHVMIRRAVGIWLRDAIVQWSDAHSGPAHLLLIEAPLVGGRMSELAYQADDRAEPLLSGRDVHFYVPTPTHDVRLAIEAARRAETASHRHARDAANAVPALVDELWQMVAQTAARLSIRVAEPLSGYSPEAYFAVYRAVLRHRRVTEVPVEEIVSAAGSPHALDKSVDELVPASVDVAALIARAEAEGDESVAARAARWYET